MKLNRALVMATALACGLSATPMMAQDRPGAPPTVPTPSTTTQDRQPAPDRAAPQVSTASGQLVSVDAKTKMFTIKTADGANLMFSYTDATKVIGADEGVSGLATKAGTDVTVQYTKNGQNNVASEIDVQKPKV